VRQDTAGEAIVLRAPATEPMMDAGGKVVRDRAVSMPLGDLRTRIRGSAK
jgi:hypothetical protein